MPIEIAALANFALLVEQAIHSANRAVILDPKHQLDQGQDVYHHILFFAGNRMTDTVQGDLANFAEMAVDIRQVRGGRQESLAEVKDDVAGMKVGDAMVATTRAGAKADYAGLAQTIMY